MQTKRKNQNKSVAFLPSLVSYCPLCDTSFLPNQAAVIGDGGMAQLLHVNCQRCASSIVLLLMVGELGVSSVGLITDLTGDDVLRVKDAEPISGDDLIDLHQLLESEEGALLE